MTAERVFCFASHLHPAAGEPIRSVVCETADAAVVAWQVLPGQQIAPHVHPEGQDTWLILSGQGDYQLDTDGRTVPVRAGDLVVAPRGSVHGIVNTGAEPLVFAAVVSPAASGFDLLPPGGAGTPPDPVAGSAGA